MLARHLPVLLWSSWELDLQKKHGQNNFDVRFPGCDGGGSFLGIIATLTLMYKLYMVHNLRTLGLTSSEDRLSIGSLQLYVDERLIDAPPRYSRTAPIGFSIYPVAAYMNAGFIHNNSLPPPLYEERKDENVSNTHTYVIF